MKARVFVLAAFLLVSACLSAQENEKRFVYSNITEIGLSALNFKGFSYEATSAHGILLDKKHNLGIGIGFGFNMPQNSNVAYIPLFFNYRFYFKPDKSFSPCINLAIGGLLAEYEGGFYSSFTGGFKAGVFSFSSGISLMAVKIDDGGWIYSQSGELEGFVSDYKWYYPFGIILKWGFAF